MSLQLLARVLGKKRGAAFSVLTRSALHRGSPGKINRSHCCEMTSGCKTPESLPAVTGSCPLGRCCLWAQVPEAKLGQWSPGKTLLTGSGLGSLESGCLDSPNQPSPGALAMGHLVTTASFLQFIPSVTEGKPVRWGREFTSCV